VPHARRSAYRSAWSALLTPLRDRMTGSWVGRPAGHMGLRRGRSPALPGDVPATQHSYLAQVGRLTPSEPSGSMGMESKAPQRRMGCAEVL
jgi:hypothetical protein